MSGRDQRGADPGQVKILVIDPDRDNRAIAVAILEHGGYSVVSATGAVDGLALAARERPALIVTELFERAGDGWEILRSLKEAPETREIPVIACSAHALRAGRDAALVAGAARHLAKPLPPQELEAVVEELLRDG